MMRDFHPGEFGRIVELRGRTNPYFSRVAEELQMPRPIGDTGLFASCQGSGAVLAARSRRVAEFFGHPPESPGHQCWVTGRRQDAQTREAVAGEFQPQPR